MGRRRLMGYLYVTESSAKVTFEENSFYVKKKDNSTTRIPAETLESIIFFNNNGRDFTPEKGLCINYL